MQHRHACVDVPNQSGIVLEVSIHILSAHSGHRRNSTQLPTAHINELQSQPRLATELATSVDTEPVIDLRTPENPRREPPQEKPGSIVSKRSQEPRMSRSCSPYLANPSEKHNQTDQA